MEWLHSQCSVSCGNGTQERQVVCSSPQTSLHNCSEPRPITKRTCHAPPCNGRYQLTSLPFLWPNCKLLDSHFSLFLQATTKIPSFSGCPGPTQTSRLQRFPPVNLTNLFILSPFVHIMLLFLHFAIFPVLFLLRDSDRVICETCKNKLNLLIFLILVLFLCIQTVATELSLCL